MTTFHIITLFPDSFDVYLSSSIIGRALKNKKIRVKFYDLYKFVEKGRRADDRPYGGGPGMVLRPEPILRAAKKAKGKVILFSTAGKLFDNKLAAKWTKNKDLVLVCGRYEGVDARVRKILKAEEISVGPYVLTGGELPAMIVLDAVTRQLPGVLGKDESVEERRVASPEVYTRPEALKHGGKKYRVPKVLLSGHHEEIEKWRRKRKSDYSQQG